MRTLDIAKRLIDYGFHPPTIYFPLIVEEGMLIEPTETESIETLDAFADALIAIAAEAQADAGARPRRPPRRPRPAARRGDRGAPAEPALAADGRRRDAVPGLTRPGRPGSGMNLAGGSRVSWGKTTARSTMPEYEDAATSEPADDLSRRRIRAEEAALLKRMQSDDMDAFEAFFLRYRTPIYRTAYGLTGDPQAAEEILQDTFARAYQRRHILRSDVSPLPWLHRVALNLCYSRLGRRRVPSEPMGDAVLGLIRDLATEPAEHAEQQELRRIVRDGVANLPPKHQSVVILYYLHGLSLQETAELLDVRLGTVKSRLHYALRSLRTRLEGDRRFGGAYDATGTLVVDPEEAVR